MNRRAVRAWGALIPLILLLLLPAAPAAAQDAPFTLVTILEPLDAVSAQTSVIAPDGSAVAFFAGTVAVGIFDLNEGSAALITLPDTPFTPVPPAWSPDSRYLAFTDGDIGRADSDIYVLDRAAQTVVNVSDDGVTGDLRATNQALVDTLPFWHPVDGGLYFFRSRPRVAPLTLFRVLPAAEGWSEPELLLNLGEALGGRAASALYPSPLQGLAGTAVFSPDGARLALIIGGRTAQAGIWVVTLADGSAQQMAGSATVRLGEPTYAYRGQPYSLAWLDERTVIAQIGSLYLRNLVNLLRIDVDANTVTPVFAFGGETGYYPEYDMPLYVSLVDDTLILLNRDTRGGRFGISALPMTENAAPTLIAPVENAAFGGQLPSLISSVGRSDDGTIRVLFGGWLFELAAR